MYWYWYSITADPYVGPVWYALASNIGTIAATGTISSTVSIPHWLIPSVPSESTGTNYTAAGTIPT